MMVGVIIRYNRKTGDRCVKVYDGPNGYLDAGNDPAYLRDSAKVGTDWEVALIGSDSLASVMHTHSRYFSGKDRTKELAAQFE
ncbi:hypothetical protein BISA_0607 [Bifidobacterium saguini DSM 23967]|uniref:Uncharacterized protein n=3 Tax=Bifidobacterium TaxID=1678 RepID=A0A2N5IRV5_9BIFI|nr:MULTISPECIES: hypothetical protein [Bifidobacterium]KFI92211.1 hypothetical protein BISA_0607 [Bifidobacterium saguini DSM 23967]PLS24698.1 hypothetical protein Tam1G_1286 [Bifidobacterium imperatoris]QSY57484.1 hypothetical protein BLI708_09680 [Bifidobacterium imperatoris]QTB90927.1 hypothetical protein BSD967_00270 [Bifidobacterium saguini]